MASSSPFHLAFTVHDIDETRAFFGGLLGCTEGYLTDKRVDFNLFGNHLVAHLRRDVAAPVTGSIVTDEQNIPLPHFGVILARDTWQALVDRLKQRGAKFMFEPRIVRSGTPHEQAIFFLTDPSGNTFEFKGLPDPTPAQLLARR
ncbi:MAG: VOC family protein [Candidatus Rokubacteria bacterium]|nr:VOC family protein [Candidatus Rokubacteria bacterium]